MKEQVVSFFLLLVCLSVVVAVKQPHINVGVKAITPSTAAKLITQQIVNNSGTFLQWDYGCSIIYDAMWEALEVFGGDYAPVLNKYLDEYETTPNHYGYEVLHNINIPWTSAVGDSVGLFPIAYLARAQYYSKNSTYNKTDDFDVATVIGSKYVAGYPYRLKDGTYSRAGGWSGEKGGNYTFVWADDSFMGMALLSRLAIILNKPDYLETIVNQQVTFASHLRDTVDGIFRHGYNDEDHHQSCCKWSRANGWLMMSHVEVLLALQQFPTYQPTLFSQIKSIFVAHAQAAAKVQSSDGRWHQVLNETSTFLETSCTGMFLLSFITGVQNGWLSKSDFDHVIQQAWAGLQNTIQSNGVVTGICAGTGIGTSVSEYEARPTNYLASSPGLGSVLRAVTAYQKYMSS